jgi:hypothetical protein
MPGRYTASQSSKQKIFHCPASPPSTEGSKRIPTEGNKEKQRESEQKAAKETKEKKGKLGSVQVKTSFCRGPQTEGDRQAVYEPFVTFATFCSNSPFLFAPFCRA